MSGRVKKQKPLAKNNVSLFLIIFMLVVLMSTIIYATLQANKIVAKTENNNQPYEVRLLPYDYKVSNYVGFVLDSDLLHLGTGSPGTTLKREINLSALQNTFVEVQWEGPGNISVDKNNFFIEPNTTQTITFFLKIGENESYGMYAGLIYLNFYKEKPSENQ